MKNLLFFALTIATASIFSINSSAADLETATPVVSSAEPASGQYLRDELRDRSATLWRLSLAPLAATQFLDSYSSRGLHELNPVLASPDGQFGPKAVLLKAAIVGALVGVEYLVVRKHPAAAKVFWKINLASAAVTGGVAARNFAQH